MSSDYNPFNDYSIDSNISYDLDAPNKKSPTAKKVVLGLVAITIGTSIGVAAAPALTGIDKSPLELLTTTYEKITNNKEEN